MDEVLKKAMLPEDLLARQTPSLTAEEYFRFMGAIDALSPDEQTLIRLAASEGKHFHRPFLRHIAAAMRLCRSSAATSPCGSSLSRS